MLDQAPTTLAVPVSVLRLPHTDPALAELRALPIDSVIGSRNAEESIAATCGIEDGLWIGVLPPRRSARLFATPASDCRIVLSGELELELDDGDRIGVSAGDIIMQRRRGLIWRNPRSEPCRIAFIGDRLR